MRRTITVKFNYSLHYSSLDWTVKWFLFTFVGLMNCFVLKPHFTSQDQKSATTQSKSDVRPSVN